MFLPFFLELKAASIPVSLREYLSLVEGLEAGLVDYDVEGFYYLARAALVKDERYIDRFERRAGDWRIAHREAVMDFTFTADNNGIPPRAMQGLRGPADRSYARPLALTEEGRARMEAGLVAPAE